MEKLIIINYYTGDIDIYNIDNDVEIDEHLFKMLGHNMEDVHWVVAENANINMHDDLIKQIHC